MAANNLELGGPKEEGSMIGPLISQKQLPRVMGYIDEGKSDGVEGTWWSNPEASRSCLPGPMPT